MIPRLNFYYPGVDWPRQTVGYAHWHLVRLEPLLSEQQLDAAQVAMIPHIAAQAQQAWYRLVKRRAARRHGNIIQLPREVITMNGRILRDARAMKRSFRETFGGLFGTGDR